MSYLFDSSSILKATKENRVEALTGNYTLDLARYELGNILWKEFALHRRLSKEHLESLIKVVKDVLKIMNVITVDCREEGILETAGTLKMTFYDASYVHVAYEEKVPLITEDSALINKAKQRVKILSLDAI